MDLASYSIQVFRQTMIGQNLGVLLSHIETFPSIPVVFIVLDMAGLGSEREDDPH